MNSLYVEYIQNTPNSWNPKDESLTGLHQGLLNPITKDTEKLQSSSKHIRMLYIVGNEGSGHHLWENIMIAMSKLSDRVTADYIENEIVLTNCYMHVS